MTGKQIQLGVVVALSLLTACSPRDFMSRRLAGDLILSSSKFRAHQRFVLETGVISSKDYPSPEFLVLQHRGWISATPAPCPRELTPPPCWDIVLTPSGVDAVRSATPGEQNNVSAIAVPVAKRALVGIVGIAKDGDSADVEFRWKWTPLNEIGAALYSGDLQYKSVVAFRKYDDGWRMLERNPHSGQSMEDALKNGEPAE